MRKRLPEEFLQAIPLFPTFPNPLPKGFMILNPAWDPNYDVDTYRTEINKAMNHFKNTLGPKLFEIHKKDMYQAIDLELWQATKRYEDEMNEKLAYRIARSTAASYITKQICRPGGVINVPTKVLFAEQPLEQVNEHDEEFIPPEVENAYATSQEEMRKATFGAQRLERQKKVLRILKNKWSGSKRKVAEAMLAGKSLAEVPGISRATAFRIKAVITAEVEAQAQHKQ